ncbi:hypothetical protein [Breoghania sp. L-A4]|uniref:CopG family ribbon-helix-helix protein n=1 Tax=Breoghania sp. L-A4 TaxID=2304600 RepID=UPI000E35FDC9|nr:hypothetical protein [Breoghania sp. L-A4]AXS39330.1 hypothetical protein D1F64_03760 [Breoghania sp. L-A4]
MTSSARFSMRLEPELKAWLEQEAKRQDRSAGYIAARAIAAQKVRSEARHRVIAEAIAEADKGIFVSEEAMNAWVASWDTDMELPEPQPDIVPEPSGR